MAEYIVVIGAMLLGAIWTLVRPHDRFWYDRPYSRFDTRRWACCGCTDNFEPHDCAASFRRLANNQDD
jgi:hypothetical protein